LTLDFSESSATTAALSAMALLYFLVPVGRNKKCSGADAPEHISCHLRRSLKFQTLDG